MRQLRNWSVQQRKFLDRVQKQLLRETILTKTDLDQEPFKADEGFKQLDKLMGGELENSLQTIRAKLYPPLAA